MHAWMAKAMRDACMDGEGHAGCMHGWRRPCGMHAWMAKAMRDACMDGEGHAGCT
jgi:hypothetical protein